VAAGMVPGGSRRNLAFAETWTEWGAGVTDLQRIVATDAQTSGGLLLATPPAAVDQLRGRLAAAGEPSWVVGMLVAGPPEPLRVV